MAYKDTYLAMSEEQIIRAITIAAADVARDVFVEAGATPNHDVRLALVSYAGPRTSDFQNFAKELALVLLVLNPTLGAASLDSAFKTAVAGVWTAYAQLLQARGLIVLPVVTP